MGIRNVKLAGRGPEHAKPRRRCDMGALMIKEGDDVWLVDVPAKLVNAEVIRSGDFVFIKYNKTTFRCHEFSVCRLYKTEKWAFPLCLKSWPWQRDFMDVLVKLGLMSKERR